MLLDTPSIRAKRRNFARKAKISKTARLNLQADHICVARFWIRQSRISLAFLSIQTEIYGHFINILEIKISQKLYKMSAKMILQTFFVSNTRTVGTFCTIIKVCKFTIDMLLSQSVNGPDFPVKSVSRSKTCKQDNDA